MQAQFDIDSWRRPLDIARVVLLIGALSVIMFGGGHGVGFAGMIFIFGLAHPFLPIVFVPWIGTVLIIVSIITTNPLLRIVLGLMGLIALTVFWFMLIQGEAMRTIDATLITSIPFFSMMIVNVVCIGREVYGMRD